MPTLHEIGPVLPGVAREVLKGYLRCGRMPLQRRAFGLAAPVFVTLHTGMAALRGCIGTLVAQHSDIFDETANNAVSAATRDPRFSPVEAEELVELVIDVTVLHPLEWVPTVAELDPKRYGVLVRGSGARQGVLLPDLPGIEDVQQQIRIARQKARLADTDPVELYRFVAERFSETA